MIRIMHGPVPPGSQTFSLETILNKRDGTREALSSRLPDVQFFWSAPMHRDFGYGSNAQTTFKPPLLNGFVHTLGLGVP